MKIIDRLNNFKYMSDNIRLYVGRIIATLNQLDMLENETPTTDEDTEEHERKTDNLMVDMFEFIQWIGVNYNQIDYGCEYSLLEKELENELMNDFTVSTDILKRKLQRFTDIVRDSMWPFVWDKTEYLNFTQSLSNGELKNKIKHHLLNTPSMTEFWERMEWSNDYPFIINGKPLDESRAEQIAHDWVWRLEYYFRQGYLCQQAMMDKIEEADKALNPQPDNNKVLPSIFQQFEILRNNFRVKNAFVYAIEAGLMEVDGVYFKWLKKRQVLAYFCWSIGHVLIPDADNVQWSVFNGMFIAKRGGEYEIENNDTLRRCYIDYENKTPNHKKDNPPDGWKIVDDIIEKVKN